MKLKKYLFLMVAGLLTVACGLFISCEEEEMEPYVSHYIYYRSEVDGYSSGVWPRYGYEETPGYLNMDYIGINYPFCEYSIEIRKGSEKGNVVKRFTTIKGEEIIDEITDERTGETFKKIAEEPKGKTSETWEGIEDYSEFDAYVVLTAVNFPEVTVEFDRDNSDFTADYNLFFWVEDKTSKTYVLKETLSEADINDSFKVVVIDKNADIESFENDGLRYDFTLAVTVDDVPAPDVVIVSEDSSASLVDWKKFTYQKLDPENSHTIRVAVKKI